MRVAIDIHKINEFGVGTYIWNLIRNLATLDSETEYLLIGSHRNFHELGPLPRNFRQLYQPEEGTFWRHHIVIPFSLRRRNIDVLHIPHHNAPFFAPSKLVVTIHDCVHLLFPDEDASKFQNYRSYLQTKRVVESARHVLTVSKSTKEDLTNIFELPTSKISVVHNALDERFAFRHTTEERKRVLERYQLKDPFVLYAGKIRPHKNLHRLIEAFAVLKSELVDDERYKNLKLIIIGDELSKHQYLRLTVVRSGAQQDVRFFGFVPYPILHVRALERLDDFVGVLEGCLSTDFRIGSGAQPLRELRADLEFHRSFRLLKRLHIRIRYEKVDATETRIDHPIDGVGSTTADAHYLDRRAKAHSLIEQKFDGSIDRYVHRKLLNFATNFFNPEFEVS